MRDKYKKLIIKYPEYIGVLLELNCDEINTVYNMEQDEANKLLYELNSKRINQNKKSEEEKQQVLFYSNL